jgi:HlyD family secretion protein
MFVSTPTEECVPARRLSAVSLVATLLAIAALGCADDAAWVKGGGMVEMDEIDVASLESGRVIRLAVEEGDTVAAGDTVAVLHSGELITNVQAQRGTAEQVAAQSREVVAGPRSEEIRAARADVASAEAALTLAEKDLARAVELQKSQVIAQADVDRAAATRDADRAVRDAARERLRQLEAGSRREEVAAARGAASAAHAQLEGARTRLGELVLTAPARGVVLLRNFDLGEVAEPGQPVVTLGDPTRMWVRVYIAAPKIDRVRVGAHADVFTNGWKGTPYSGRVASVATRAEFTPRAALTEEERANLVFAVRVRLDPSAGALKPGLPVMVRIAVPGASPPAAAASGAP